MQIKKFFNPCAILLSIFLFTSAVLTASDEAPRKIVVFQKNFKDRAAQHALVKKEWSYTDQTIEDHQWYGCLSTCRSTKCS